MYDNMWHHITGVYKIYEPGVSSEVMLYQDGMKEGSLACNGSSVATPQWGVAIGANSYRVFTMYPHAWWGFIDDVRLFNRALSHAEIIGVIREALPGPEAHYEFETVDGDVTPDSSGNNRPGTLVSGASIVYDTDRDSNVLDIGDANGYVNCGGGHALSEPNCQEDPGKCEWADFLGEFTVTAWVKPDPPCAANMPRSSSARVMMVDTTETVPPSLIARWKVGQ